MTELNSEIALDLSVPNNQQPAMKKTLSLGIVTQSFKMQDCLHNNFKIN